MKYPPNVDIMNALLAHVGCPVRVSGDEPVRTGMLRVADWLSEQGVELGEDGTEGQGPEGQEPPGGGS